MAIKIGITGGIGSGKSVISHLLAIMGIPVYIADDESKRITANDAVIRQELIQLLGDEVFNNGELNRKLLASYLFSDPEHARIVNGMIHPKVKDDFINWVSRNSNHPILAMESAILIESGFAKEVDLIVIVSAPLELRLKRLTLRDSSSVDLIMKRIKSQMSDEEKKKFANFVIVNDDEAPVIPQIAELIKFATFQSVS